MLDAKKCCLVVIDVQDKLARLMYDKDSLFGNIEILIKAATALEVGIILCQQNPDALGATIPQLAELLKDNQPVNKFSFSCCGEDQFNQRLKADKPSQVILCGIEAHVCVYQTAMDLLDKDYEVCVAADAISSRTAENKEIALRRMESEGVSLSCTEMILFELLKTSKHPKFKELAKLIR